MPGSIVKGQGILRGSCRLPVARQTLAMANILHANLSSSQHRRLYTLRHDPAPKPREWERVEVLLLSAEGMRVSQLALHFGCRQATMWRWPHQFVAERRQSLCHLRRGLGPAAARRQTVRRALNGLPSRKRHPIAYENLQDQRVNMIGRPGRSGHRSQAVPNLVDTPRTRENTDLSGSGHAPFRRPRANARGRVGQRLHPLVHDNAGCPGGPGRAAPHYLSPTARNRTTPNAPSARPNTKPCPDAGNRASAPSWPQSTPVSGTSETRFHLDYLSMCSAWDPTTRVSKQTRARTKDHLYNRKLPPLWPVPDNGT